MSSTFEVSSAKPRPANGQAESRIIHFDATERRREKMRRSSSGEKAAVVEPVAVPKPAPKPAPVVEKKPAATTEARPWTAAPASAVNAAFNGNRVAHPATNGTSTPAAKPAAPKAASNGAMDSAALEKFLISFVVEQTGYPAEMVELDADLEADLGIDSIKKAQLFGELAEHFEVTASATDLSLDDFPTLRHVLNFLKDKPARGAAGTNGHAAPAPVTPTKPVAAPKPVAAAPTAKVVAPAPVKAAPAAPAAAPQRSLAELETFLINFVVEQTGYPAEMVELDADLEADLGIDSIKKAQLFGELAEHFEVTASATDLSLDDFPTLRHVLNFLADKPSRGSAPATQPASAAAPVAAKPVTVAAAPATKPAAAAPVTQKSVAPPAAKSNSMPSAELETFLINFVVEQTGYPAEMVELDADLEADLGIDSIKKAQLFGELAEHFEVTSSATELSLDDFPTLRHVMNFLANVPRRG